MPKPYRRILFFCFLGFFLVFAPLLILYTAGYRYSWSRGRVQETGVLIMEYKPKNASIVLNGQQQKEQTPAHFSGLLPGRYSIEVAAKGYRSWKKKLWVEPSRTTFAQHMILWKNTPEQKILFEQPTTQLTMNTQGVSAFVHRDGLRDRLFVSNPEHETVTEIPFDTASKTLTIKTVQWSPKGRRLFIETGGASVSSSLQQWIWSTTDSTPILLSSIRKGDPLTNVRWSVNDDDLLYGFSLLPAPRHGERLMEIDLFRGSMRSATYTTTTPNTPPYIVEDNLLYRVETVTAENEQLSTLIITPLSETSRALERRIPLPQHTNHISFLPSPDALITLLDQDHKTLFIIDKETRALYPIQETIEGVTDAVWSPKGNRLLWSTGKELWLLDLERSSREQLRVEEQKIQEILWHPGNEYVFFAVGDSVHVLEIDGRDERNIESIVTLSGRKNLLLSESGEMLMSSGTLTGQIGLFTFQITQ